MRQEFESFLDLHEKVTFYFKQKCPRAIFTDGLTFFYLENSIIGDGSVVGCSTSPRVIIIIL